MIKANVDTLARDGRNPCIVPRPIERTRIRPPSRNWIESLVVQPFIIFDVLMWNGCVLRASSDSCGERMHTKVSTQTIVADRHELCRPALPSTFRPPVSFQSFDCKDGVVNATLQLLCQRAAGIRQRNYDAVGLRILLSLEKDVLQHARFVHEAEVIKGESYCQDGVW